jgi:hypothetical protein
VLLPARKKLPSFRAHYGVNYLTLIVSNVSQLKCGKLDLTSSPICIVPVLYVRWPNPKSLAGGKSRLWRRVMVDSVSLHGVHLLNKIRTAYCAVYKYVRGTKNTEFHADLKQTM